MKNYVQTVYVDADSCPVKEEIENLCKKYNKKLVFVASYAHSINSSEGTIVQVDSRDEEADLYIVNHCQKSDIVVTQDYGLAAWFYLKEFTLFHLVENNFLRKIWMNCC